MKCWFYIGITLFAFACNSNSTSEHTRISFQRIEEFRDDTSYTAHLDAGAYKIKVYALDHKVAQELVVHTNDGEKLLCEIRRTLPGAITNAFIQDLNQDGYPELYVLSQERADSTALIAFQLFDNEYSEIEIPGIADNASRSFSFTNNQIIQHVTLKDGQSQTTCFSLSPAGLLTKELS